MSPRTGRPRSVNPKEVDIKVRIDRDTNNRLIELSQKNKTTRTELIRRGINLILDSGK